MKIGFKIRFYYPDECMMRDPIRESRNQQISALGLEYNLFPKRTMLVRLLPDLFRPRIEEPLPFPFKTDIIPVFPLPVGDLMISFNKIVVIGYLIQ